MSDWLSGYTLSDWRFWQLVKTSIRLELPSSWYCTTSSIRQIAYSDNVIGMKDGKALVEGDPGRSDYGREYQELYGIELGVTRVDGRKFVLAV